MFNLETAKERANGRRCGRCNDLDTVVSIKLNDNSSVYICLPCAGIMLAKLVKKEGDEKLNELL